MTRISLVLLYLALLLVGCEGGKIDAEAAATSGQVQSSQDTSETDARHAAERVQYAEDYYFDEVPFPKNSTNVKGIEIDANSAVADSVLDSFDRFIEGQRTGTEEALDDLWHPNAYDPEDRLQVRITIGPKNDAGEVEEKEQERFLTVQAMKLRVRGDRAAITYREWSESSPITLNSYRLRTVLFGRHDGEWLVVDRTGATPLPLIVPPPGLDVSSDSDGGTDVDWSAIPETDLPDGEGGVSRTVAAMVDNNYFRMRFKIDRPLLEAGASDAKESQAFLPRLMQISLPQTDSPIVFQLISSGLAVRPPRQSGVEESEGTERKIAVSQLKLRQVAPYRVPIFIGDRSIQRFERDATEVTFGYGELKVFDHTVDVRLPLELLGLSGPLAPLIRFAGEEVEDEDDDVPVEFLPDDQFWLTMVTASYAKGVRAAEPKEAIHVDRYRAEAVRRVALRLKFDGGSFEREGGRDGPVTAATLVGNAGRYMNTDESYPSDLPEDIRAVSIFPHLRRLTLCGDIDAATLDALSQLPPITFLSFGAPDRQTTLGNAGKTTQLPAGAWDSLPDFPLETIVVHASDADLDPITRQLLRFPALRRIVFSESLFDPNRLSADAAQNLSELKELEELTLSGLTEISPELLRAIGRLPKLRFLDLSDSEVSDVALAELRTLPNLQELILDDNPLTGTGLADFASADSLRSLSMKDTKANAAAMKHVGRFSGLRRLWLEDPDLIRDEGLRALAGLSELRTFIIVRSSDPLDQTPAPFTDRGYAALANMTRLEELELAGEGFTDASADVLAGMTHLRRLKLGATKLTGPGMAKLAPLTEMRELDLSGSPLDDRGFVALSNMTKLAQAHLSAPRQPPRVGPRVTDKGMQHLSGLIHLKNLNLSNTNVSDAGLESLQDMKSLERLTLNGTLVRGPGLRFLKNCDRIENLELAYVPLLPNGVGLEFLAELEALRSVTLYLTRLDNDTILRMSDCDQIEYLYLSGCMYLYDAEPFAELESLRTVSVSQTQISAHDAEALKERLSKQQNGRTIRFKFN